MQTKSPMSCNANLEHAGDFTEAIVTELRQIPSMKLDFKDSINSVYVTLN